MEKDRINRLTKEAQEKFEKAKAEILAELEQKLNEKEETHEETAECVAKTIDDACKNCKCNEMDISEGAPLRYVNKDAIHWDDDNMDYREVSILYEPDKDGEPQRVCIEFDDDLENEQIQIVLLNALAELIADRLDGHVTFDEARSLVHSGWAAILIALAEEKVKNAFENIVNDIMEGF